MAKHRGDFRSVTTLGLLSLGVLLAASGEVETESGSVLGVLS